METTNNAVLSPMGSPVKASFFDDTKDTTLFFSPGNKKNLWITANMFSKIKDFYKLYTSPTLLHEGTLHMKKGNTGAIK